MINLNIFEDKHNSGIQIKVQTFVYDNSNVQCETKRYVSEVVKQQTSANEAPSGPQPVAQKGLSTALRKPI